MNILITGGSGQLGWEMRRCLAPFGAVWCPDRHELDLTRPDAVRQSLAARQPDLIVNCAAYTAVDSAQTEAALARTVNSETPAVMAGYARQVGAGLIHFSTDYVFGDSGLKPLRETDPTAPVNVYGTTKLAGEQAIADSGCAHLIFRTSWVYSHRGSNFLRTMLRVARQHPTLRVVDDQIGAPTAARSLASMVAAALAGSGLTAKPVASALEPVSGLYHLCNAGHVSWHKFAEAIFELRTEMTGEAAPQVLAIPTSEYPTPAKRPTNSRLDLSRFRAVFGLEPPDWRQTLKLVMQDLPDLNPPQS